MIRKDGKAPLTFPQYPSSEAPTLESLRQQFAEQYAAKKGWNKNELSWDQVQEIRSQPQWKDLEGK